MAKTKQLAAQKSHDLKKYLEDIKRISDWFEEQEEIDLEEALVKIREAGELIKLSKDRLVEVENEFREIKTKIEAE
jgi:light-regulated signal transduction histidine kinase (bacteriophytochrome)